MRTYSTVIIIDSLLKSEEIDNTIEKIERTIKNNGGEILEVNRWGKRRLAYEIKKRQYGYYVDITFKGKGNIVKVIEREYKLDENILRYLTSVLDDNLLVQPQQEISPGETEEMYEVPVFEEEQDEFENQEDDAITEEEKIVV